MSLGAKEQVLAENAKRINQCHNKAVECNRLSETKGREAIKAVIIAGKNLIACKEMVEHGEWLPWLSENCQVISEDVSGE